MTINKVLIVFKTHLDIGFTDFASVVKQKYFDVFIPNAIQTARELKERNADASFKWTTGSWLIAEYLRINAGSEKAEALRSAIRSGDICWHGLPCTTHTEIMTGELFDYGLSLSRKLDAEFGVRTIAAKMTDVPGHTKCIIPQLKKAGIELLHIGVNPASAVPDVPEIFRWEYRGERITVIYNGEYGNLTPLGDTGTALYFAHTNDNLGGQTADEVIETFRTLRAQFPHAELTAANLNDAALVLREIEDALPVIGDEIGDSWIHGTATDPKKIMQFRAMCRLYADMPEGEDKETLARGLLMIPEHTWGLDEKTHLHDETHFAKEAFRACRELPNFRKMEASWQEQRQFLYDAVNALSTQWREKALPLLDAYKREETDVSGYTKVLPGETFAAGPYTLRFNESGAIDFLAVQQRVYADETHLWGLPLYEVFSFDNYVTFHKRYHRIEDDWAWQDFTKIGMENAIDRYANYTPAAEIYARGTEVVVRFTFPEEAYSRFGAPHTAEMKYTFDQDTILADFAWFGKDANRIAEAIWLGFNPIASDRRICKLYGQIDPQHVVSRGNRNLHATDQGVVFGSLSIHPLDSALVSPQKPCVLDYPNVIPTEEEGLYFGLYNNLWGTNFPMWYEEDARFRFRICLHENESSAPERKAF